MGERNILDHATSQMGPLLPNLLITFEMLLQPSPNYTQNQQNSPISQTELAQIPKGTGRSTVVAVLWYRANLFARSLIVAAGLLVQ